jgi:DNA-binding IclR family transcriptional regulator
VAWLPDKTRKSVLPNKFEKLASRTITSITQFEKELATVRERGYAIADEEMEDGFTAVAAPIRNSHQEVIAAIVISGPTNRMTKLGLASVGKNLAKNAQLLSGNPTSWQE